MSIEELEAALGDMLPPWAVGVTSGQLVIGAHLPTRDGRRCGNAHIIDATAGCLCTGQLTYTVLTDAGTRMWLSVDEIAELFYPPRYISSVGDVLAKFDRECVEGD